MSPRLGAGRQRQKQSFKQKESFVNQVKDKIESEQDIKAEKLAAELIRGDSNFPGAHIPGSSHVKTAQARSGFSG